MTEMVDPCPRCGGEAEVMLTCGGAYIYYSIACKACGLSSRTYGSLRGLAPLGFGPGENAPQNSRAEAVERWGQMRSASQPSTTQGEKST